MFERGGLGRYFIGLALVIVLLIVVIILIVNHGGSKNSVPGSQRPLTSYVNDPGAEVRLTINGPINAPQNHRQVQVTVSNSQTIFDLQQGYDGHILTSKSYDMTTNAFDNFLHALDHAGFTQGNNDPSLKNETGYCASGARYIFELRENGNDVERFWATNCGGTKTYKGNVDTTINLFQAQVPDYDTLTQDVDLGGGSGPSLFGL